MNDKKNKEFHSLIMPHLDAAYNYAYWLTRNSDNAQDLTQEACLRAFAAFGQFKKQYPKAWLMTIVRNTFFNQIQKQQRRGEVIYFDEQGQNDQQQPAMSNLETPEYLVLRNAEINVVRKCIDKLPEDYREVIMLRDLEGLSYHEISQVIECPQGTVMSRISRARENLKSMLITQGYSREVKHELQ